MPSKPERTKVNWREAAFSTYSLQGKPQADLSWHNLSWDDATSSGFFLIRFAPGGVSIPHEHLAHEEFVVLEGELEDHDGTVYRAGDCVSLAPGTRHFTRSKHGAVSAVFIRGGFRTLDQGEPIGKISTRHGKTRPAAKAAKPPAKATSRTAAKAPAKAKPAVSRPVRARPAGGRTPGSPRRSKRA
jgi:quercetin dioxygenase-like cupin family protein